MFKNILKLSRNVFFTETNSNNKIFVEDNFKSYEHLKRIEELCDAPLFQNDIIDTPLVKQRQNGYCFLKSAVSRFASIKI